MNKIINYNNSIKSTIIQIRKQKNQKIIKVKKKLNINHKQIKM